MDLNSTYTYQPHFTLLDAYEQKENVQYRLTLNPVSCNENVKDVESGINTARSPFRQDRILRAREVNTPEPVRQKPNIAKLNSTLTPSRAPRSSSAYNSGAAKKISGKQFKELDTGKYRQKLEQTCSQIKEFRRNLCTFTKFLQTIGDDRNPQNEADFAWKNPSTRTPRRM